MRNLKRALSLALASVMLLGMMVVGSSAKGIDDFTDKAEIVNQDAVAVTSAIGMFEGYEDGSFGPENVVTRAEMAVIITRILYGNNLNVDQFKGLNTFTDVPEWAEPYVAACYTNGITSGYDKVTYGGNDTVTTGSGCLMLLKALGYFQYSSDFGSDWQLATVSQGNKIDLFDDVDSGVREAMTRNDLAQLVLNTLESGTVEAEKTGQDISVGDITITSGVTYKYVTSGKDYAMQSTISWLPIPMAPTPPAHRGTGRKAVSGRSDEG